MKCADCPHRRNVTTYVPYGDTVTGRVEIYCAMGRDPDECEEEEE